MAEVVYIGQGEGIGWARMMNGEQKNVERYSGQKAILSSSNHVAKRMGVWEKATYS